MLVEDSGGGGSAQKKKKASAGIANSIGSAVSGLASSLVGTGSTAKSAEAAKGSGTSGVKSPKSSGTKTTGSTGGSISIGGSSSSDYYQNALDALRSQQSAAEARLQAGIDQGVARLEGQKTDLRADYDDGVRQAYIALMQARKQLPQSLSARGLGGGITESSLVDLENSYGSNLNSLYREYLASLSNLDRQIAELQATGGLTLAQNSADYADRRASLAAEQQANTAERSGSLYPTQSQELYEKNERVKKLIGSLTASYDNSGQTTYDAVVQDLSAMAAAGQSNGTLQNFIRQAYQNGFLTTAEYYALFKKYRR